MVLLGPVGAGSVPSTPGRSQDGTLDQSGSWTAGKGMFPSTSPHFFHELFKSFWAPLKLIPWEQKRRTRLCRYLGANQMCQIDNLLFHFKQKQRQSLWPSFLLSHHLTQSYPRALGPYCHLAWGLLRPILPSPLIVLSQVSYQTFKNLSCGTKKRKKIFVFWEFF